MRFGYSDYGDDMTTAMAAERPMASDRKNMPVRVAEESLKLARIAASYQGKTLADYVSDSLAEVAKRDIEQGHAGLADKPKAKAKPAK